MKDNIGHSYVTKFGNVLKVKDYYTICGKGRYILECSTCSKDVELFPYGSIDTSKDSVKEERCVCGCNPKYKYKKYQNDIKIRRRCAELGYKFIDYVGEYNGVFTKLILSNPVTGNIWDTTSVQTFLLNGVKDPKQHFSNLSNFFTLPSKHFITNFKNTGAFLEGTIFSRVEGSRWEYTCPRCSEDEYVQNDLCSGVFTSSGGHLSQGKLSCRCTQRFRWSPQQREYQITKLMSPLGWKFIKWKDTYKGKNSKFEWVCNKGHINETSVTNFLKRVSCKGCSANGYKNFIEGILYVVRWQDNITKKTFLKYGITNQSVNIRINSQGKKTSYSPTTLFTFKGDGVSVEMCEKKIKLEVGGNFCSREVMPRGFTETVEDTPENLSKILQIITTFNLTQSDT